MNKTDSDPIDLLVSSRQCLPRREPLYERELLKIRNQLLSSLVDFLALQVRFDLVSRLIERYAAAANLPHPLKYGVTTFNTKRSNHFTRLELQNLPFVLELRWPTAELVDSRADAFRFRGILRC